MKKWFPVVCMLFLSLIVTTDSHAVIYESYDLYPSGINAWSSKTQLNNNGEIVAFEYLQDGSQRMFFYNPMTGVQTHAEYIDMFIWDVNDKRQVAGWVENMGGFSRAVVWDPLDGLTSIGTWQYGSYASSINEAGAVVGYASIGPAQCHAFYWTRSNGAQELGTLGGLNSNATGINNAGQVVGSSDTADGEKHAFVWSPGGTMRDLGTLGGRYSRALGINNNGLVFGVSEVSDPYYHREELFLWDEKNGMRSAFTTQIPFDVSMASMNDNGRIAGYGHMGGFIWDPTEGLTIFDNALVYDINNAGQITGHISVGPNSYPVLWNPVPEPSSLAVLGFGLVPMAAAVRLRRRMG